MTSTPAPRLEKSYLSSTLESISPWSTSRSSTPKPKEESGKGSAQANQQGGDHSSNRNYGISLRKYPADCPPLNTRWFYAVDVPKRKPKLLKEEGISENKPLPPPKKFVTFSESDSRSVEAAYQKLVEDFEDNGRPVSRNERRISEGAAGKKENKSIGDGGIEESPEDEKKTVKVPVNEDFLFDVDIERRELSPVYWLGPIYEVRRGTWFYQEGTTLRPCEEKLSAQLEEGYLKVKPFRYPKFQSKAGSKSESTEPSVESEAGSSETPDGSKAKNITPKPSKPNLKAEAKPSEVKTIDAKEATQQATHQPETYRLFGSFMNSIVTYENDTVAWLVTDSIMSLVTSTVYQRFAGGGYLGGAKIVRGYTEPGKPAVSEAKIERPITPDSNATTEKPTGLQLDERQQRLLKRRSAPPGMGRRPDVSKAKDGEQNPKTAESSEDALKRRITSLVDESMDPEKSEEAVRRRDEKQLQDDYRNSSGEDQSREIDHLILVTHGIGQRLGLRTESVNFIHDCNILRQTLKSVYANSEDLQALNDQIDKLPKNCRVQVLPVCWRHLLDFPRQGIKQARREHDLADTSGEDEEYPSLEDITIEGVPFVRSLITDLALDILLYQSAYREHISGIVLRECNRIYKLFLERNPNFDGKVSLVGHSLGSAIIFDILCRQKEDVEVHASQHHKKFYHNRPGVQVANKKDGKTLRFNFKVDDFYALGSPIGLFQMLKGRTIAARHHPQAMPAESPMDPDHMEDPFSTASHANNSDGSFTTTGLSYSISSPKCGQVYNIFHPSDPIAYRLEPLISPAMASLKPQALPYTKKGIFGASASQGFTGIGARVGQSVSGLWSSLSSGIASSLLNRSLGLTNEDIASMERGSQGSAARDAALSAGAGTNISGGDVIQQIPALKRENTSEKMKMLAESTANADRDGSDAPTLIDDDMETLFAGFQKVRSNKPGEAKMNDQDWAEVEEKSKKLRREEMKVRGLNKNGRVDYSIQESVLDFNPMNTIASHLSYWSDEDVSHFIMSQLLSRHRAYKRRVSMDVLKNIQ